jgi:D-alanyl-D-alanine carboxypeptidase
MEMKKRNVRFWAAALLALVLLGGLLAGCAPEVRVGALQTESQSVELGDAKSVRVQIDMGAGDLEVKGGAAKLLEADFAYNVARLKPEVKYSDGTLVVRQPDTNGFPNIQSVTNFRNEWGLHLNDQVPMNLSVAVGGGSADLQLAGLSLTGLDVNLGAGQYTMDLTGGWARNLDATVDAGAANVTVRLPRDVGVRVKVEDGPHTVQATGLTADGGAYTNAAYGTSKVTLQVGLKVGIGRITLEEEEGTAASAAQGWRQDQPASTDAPPKLMDQALGKKLQAALEAAVASPETKWPGALLYVRAPGLGDWSSAAGLGAVETKTPMRPYDRFRAGSLTKPFVAAVVLQLVEEGRFTLDDSITKLLPAQVTGKFADADKITVRMLLNHTSGVADFMNTAGPQLIAHPDKVWNPEELLDFAAAQQPMFAPGEAQYYSNTNYILLGLIIEKATGRTWREELRQRIFEPLNLKDTLLPAPEESALPGDHVHGYADFGNGPFDATELVTASVVGAAGGQSLITNAPDLTRFLDALLAGKLFKKAGTLDQMLTWVKFAPNHPMSVILTDYGLGLQKASFGPDLAAIGHSGDTEGGYSSFVFHFPKQDITISGVVNMNDAAAAFSQLMPRVLEVLVPGYTMPKPVTGEQAEAGAALQGLLDDQVKKQGILGMAMAVRLADGTVVWKGSGYLDPEKKHQWTPDTLTALGSVTKSFTAVVIMQLAQEGKLSLDDTIDKWFPDQPNGDKITVRMLLSHTSGLANYINANNHFDPKWGHAWAPRDLVAEANRMGPVDQPGKSAHYSNTGYTLLGLITEAITGKSWEQAVRSRIIEPLHLQHTTFLSEKGVVGGAMVLGYAKTPHGYISSLEIPNYPHASTTWAVGAVVSTLSDLTTFATALFDGKLVSQKTLAEMATPVAKDVASGLVYGLGGATVETIPGSFGMGGDIPGYVAFFAGIENTKYVVAALVNTDEGDVIGPSMMALEYARSLSQPAQAPAPSNAAPQPPQAGAPDPGAALQGLLDEQVQKQDILGMAMAVRLADGTLVFKSSGYLDPEKKNQWTPDTVSHLGSITKSFTAVVIMQLVQAGKLSLDQTIDKWFPDQPNGDKITVRMLLSHTSGLNGYIAPETGTDPKWARPWAPLDLVAEANRRGPVDKPGSRVAHYANTNYILLGLIIEAITGNSWEQEVRSRIIEPLKLQHTAFSSDKGVWGGTLVPGYFRTPKGWVSSLEAPGYPPHPSTAWAAGTIVSSLADLMTFGSALFDGKLVSKETLAEMATGLAKDPDGVRAWGLGGATLATIPGSFGMGGDAEAYHAFYAGIQGNKYVVAALVNTSDGDPIGPSLMALDYLRSQSPGGQEPATPAQ